MAGEDGRVPGSGPFLGRCRWKPSSDLESVPSSVPEAGTTPTVDTAPQITTEALGTVQAAVGSTLDSGTFSYTVTEETWAADEALACEMAARPVRNVSGIIDLDASSSRIEIAHADRRVVVLDIGGTVYFDLPMSRDWGVATPWIVADEAASTTTRSRLEDWANRRSVADPIGELARVTAIGTGAAELAPRELAGENMRRFQVHVDADAYAQEVVGDWSDTLSTMPPAADLPPEVADGLEEYDPADFVGDGQGAPLPVPIIWVDGAGAVARIELHYQFSDDDRPTEQQLAHPAPGTAGMYEVIELAHIGEPSGLAAPPPEETTPASTIEIPDWFAATFGGDPDEAPPGFEECGTSSDRPPPPLPQELDEP